MLRIRRRYLQAWHRSNQHATVLRRRARYPKKNGSTDRNPGRTALQEGSRSSGPCSDYARLGDMTTAFGKRVSSLLQASPLRHRPFRLFYFGAIGTALGYTMQATVAAWLMATLTPSPLMVALVQTASTAPALLLGLLAGTLADIVHRRRIIFATQVVLLVATAMLGGATLAGIIGPGALLLLTF